MLQIFIHNQNSPSGKIYCWNSIGTCGHHLIFKYILLFFFSLSDDQLLEITDRTKIGTDDLYDAEVIAKINKEGVAEESSITCDLSIPGTDYTQKKTTFYYGKCGV